MAGRRAKGLDINPAAVIASRAKTTPISPVKLRAALLGFEEKICWLEDEERLGRTLFSLPQPFLPPNQERLDWWFPPGQQRRLGIILATIEATRDDAIRAFLRCAFSHCLKTASYWLMKSSKPTRDKAKVANGVPNVVPALRRHLAKMQRANAQFWRLLPEGARRSTRRVVDIRCGDARELPWREGSVDLVVTSPPYVTSYEYANLHQLTSLWLGGLDDLASSKEKFIGFYTSGRIRDLLPMMVEAGADFIQSFDTMGGDCSLGEAKALYGDKFCVVGNFSPMILVNGTVEEARQEAMRCLQEAAEGGGYILSTGDEVPPEAKVENLKAMVEVAREFG